jgi:shikimate 5-dehydrogenase
MQAVDGQDMLIYQASAAFQFWTGLKPPYQVMKEALVAARPLK